MESFLSSTIRRVTCNRNASCLSCGETYLPTQARYYLTYKFSKDNDFTILEAFQEQLKFTCSAKDLEIDFHNKSICRPCVGPLVTSYKKLKQFKAKIHPESYLQERLKLNANANANPEAAPEIPPTPMPPPTATRTPTLETLKRIVGNTKRRSAFLTFLKRLISKEVEAFKRESKFAPEKHQHQHPNPKTKTKKVWMDENSKELIEKELKNLAPTLYVILNAACNIRKLQMSFTPAMQSILGIMMYSRNPYWNYMQKHVGFTLREGKSSYETYTVLNEMGLCCSNRTIKRAVDAANEVIKETVESVAMIGSESESEDQDQADLESTSTETYTTTTTRQVLSQSQQVSEESDTITSQLQLQLPIDSSNEEEEGHELPNKYAKNLKWKWKPKPKRSMNKPKPKPTRTKKSKNVVQSQTRGKRKHRDSDIEAEESESSPEDDGDRLSSKFKR